MIFVGIDPGANGGIGVIFPSNSIAHAMKEFKTYSRLPHYLESLGEVECFALIEKVHAMPGQGVVSTFSFGYAFGVLEGCLIASGIPYDRVTPQKWQKEFGLYRLPDETKTAKKNRHKELAKELFPTLNITHATADALLIAEYCRRQYDK